MALESILGAALVYLSRQDDGVSSRLRQARRTLDGAIEALASFAGRGELVRLRAALVQDFLIGILAARNPRPNGVLPSQVGGRLELSPDEPQHWPPNEGQYDENGLSRRLGEMALLGLAITYEETRTFLVGLTQASAPTPAGRQQIGRAARALISVVSSLGLDLRSYEKAWRQVFTADSASGATTPTPLASTPPPNVAAGGSTGSATAAARADHTHGHGDQTGGTLHATATPAAPGFMSDADKGKLDGIAPGATATPLSGTPPPTVAAASGAGSDTSAARSDHTHGHGNQAGGTLHATATNATAGFMSAADKAKLDALPPGGNSHLQSIQLCAARTQQLLPNSTFGADGQVEMFALNAVPDVCTVAGTLHDFWVEGQFSPNVNVTITILRAPATGGLPSTTPITLAVPAGQFSATTAATLSVPAGERITATSNALWNHNGLVLRARLRA